MMGLGIEGQKAHCASGTLCNKLALSPQAAFASPDVPET